MVLIHGFLSCRSQWDLNVERLGKRHRLLVVDLPGHGDSPAPDDPASYQRDAVIGQLDRIRTDRGIETWWVCGQSLGGAVAARYVLAHPGASRGLIFTNSRAVFGLARRGDNDRTSATDGLESLRDLPIHPIHARRFPADLKERLVAAADRMPFHAVDHVVAHRDTWCAADELDRIEVPVLLVNGRWEKLFQPCVAVAEAAIGDLAVVHLEGGHSINVEQAAGFDDAVLSFTADR